MARDANGNYTLPAGNPVESGLTIESVWANTTMDDIAVALTDSLDRKGRGGMLAPFLFEDGTLTSPGAAWADEPSTGLRRAASGDLRMGVLGTEKMRWTQPGNPQVWDGAVWRDIAYVGGPGTVPDGANDGDYLEWDTGTGAYVVAPPLVKVPLGGSNGDTLVWDTTAWVTTPANPGGQLPVGNDPNDILEWDGSAWQAIPPTSGGTVGPGTVNNSVLTWSGVAWTENPNITVDPDGTVNANLNGNAATASDSPLWDGYSVVVTTALPPTPDPFTIYFVLQT